MEKGLATASLSIVEQNKPALKPLNESSVTPAVTGSDGVRVLSIEEYKAAALCLAEAFKDDHTTHYFLDTPDSSDWTEEQKWEVHLSMFEYIVYAHCLKGLVTTVGPNYGAVSLW